MTVLQELVMPIDWKRVSDRVRGLIGSSDAEQLSRTAEHFNVDERGLRTIVDRASRGIDLQALAGVIRVYGLDPSWVLTGVYDASTHRAALEATPAELTATLRRLSTSAVLDDADRADPEGR